MSALRVAWRIVGRIVVWLLAIGGTLAGPFHGLGLRHAGLGLLLVAVGLTACLTGWVLASPQTAERFLLGPVRRFRWRQWARRAWPTLARECGLSVSRPAKRRTVGWDPKAKGGVIATQSKDVTEWVHPRLANAMTDGEVLTLWVTARMGQTRDDLVAAVPAIATAARAVSHSVSMLSPSTVEVALVMRDLIGSTRTATGPVHSVAAVPDAMARRAPARRRSRSSVCDPVGVLALGRTVTGGRWLADLRARHTLVVGCSGSGKGSILWGVCGGLAPHIATDTVRLYGVDLKGGVEVAVGEGLFTRTAYGAETALGVLTDLLAVIGARTTAMRGLSREHHPSPGDPLHVLVVDELAALVAYGDRDTVKEASRMLSIILTQGRAVGVVVVAFVQDPRKETVGMRGLFTQVVALRLRSGDEVRMVLGDGMTALAPAHQISAASPGTGFVVAEDGTVLQVRADYWTDAAIRDAAEQFPAAVRWVSPLVENHPDAVRYVQGEGQSVASDQSADRVGAPSGPHPVTPSTPVVEPVTKPARRPRRPRKSAPSSVHNTSDVA